MKRNGGKRGCQQVKTGDSSNWTSLSIWISILTVISSSALMNVSNQEHGFRLDGILTRLAKDYTLVRKPEREDIGKR